MISRSVAQIATASMRTRTSARLGTGVGFSRRLSSSGLPSTHAFIWSGTGNSGEVLTPAGLYMAALPVASMGFAGRLVAPAADAIAFSDVAGTSQTTLTSLWRRYFVNLQCVGVSAARGLGQ